MSYMKWETQEVGEIFKRLPLEKDGHNQNIVDGFKTAFPYSTVDNFVQWATTNRAEFHWTPAMTDAEIQDLLARSPLFTNDDHNQQLIAKFRADYPAARILDLSNYINANRPLFKWRTPEPTRLSVGISFEDFIAWQKRSPLFVEDENNKFLILEWLKKNPTADVNALDAYVDGNQRFTWRRENEAPLRRPGNATDWLYEIGVQKSSRMSASEQRAEDAKKRKEIEASAQRNRDIVAEKDRNRAIREAEHFKVFRSDGRIDHAASQELRRQKLAALGIVK